MTRFDRQLPFVACMFCVLVLRAHTAERIVYTRDVRPILSDNCYQCHGPDAENREADLRLDIKDSAAVSIDLESPGESELIRRIVSDDLDLVMPPPESGKSLTEEEKTVLQNWIEQGAVWTDHWAYTPVVSPTPPAANGWAKNAIDGFVWRKMQQADLTPSPRADRATLIRRLTYDLTGLPPTIHEVEQFLADQRPGAYERLVDRLLSSEHFGERMAVMWLDAARYGDTSVYHADGPRDMWAWRDAVVNAYNNNMSFDRFSIAQLAGDQLPKASLEEQVLSGFNRNNGTTDEGGVFPEEYRVEYAVDRVKTTSTVWLGLTMECAQCHDHKYDPISQEDYYSFFAFFNVSADKGMQTRRGNAEPILSIPDPEKTAQIPDEKYRLEDLQQRLEQCIASNNCAFEEWVREQEAAIEQVPDSARGAILDVRFVEGKGKQVTSLAGKVGKLIGKAQWIDTPTGKGLKLSGKNYVDFGQVGDFERTDSFSYGGWVKAKNGALVARMDDANSYRGYDIYLNGSAVSVHLIHEWPKNAIKVTSKKKLTQDKWHHVFVTYDGSSSSAGIQIYVDGEPWEWKINEDRLTDSIRTKKSLLAGSRHPGSRLNGEIDTVQVYDRVLAPEEVATLAADNSIRSILTIAREDRTEFQLETLRDHFLRTESSEYVELKAGIAKQESKIDDLEKPLTTVMVMGDMEKPRDTFILKRGAYDAPTEHKVERRTPTVLPSMSAELPANRLGMARWLFQENHPLTGRVAVNRYWQMLFGRGLVATPEDFGSQGEYPSHDDLLDWLAADFRDHGWNIKRTIKQIVMSSTYQQSSHASAKAYRRDPDNVLLARGPRFRLQAEFIRDAALSLGGLLNKSLGGPGVKPYQPAGLWVEVGLTGKPAFRQDHGDKLFRRSLYTYWKRSAPPPTMQIFDAPTREKCTIRRPRTNTPLQALVVLNDPQFVEAARGFAQRLLNVDCACDQHRLNLAFQMATARKPRASELAVLSRVLDSAREEFRAKPQQAGDLLKVGESPRDEAIAVREHASWLVVASTLMNLDETLTRE